MVTLLTTHLKRKTVGDSTMPKTLHEVHVPDTGKGAGCHVADLYCKHCGKQMSLDDAFTTRADGYHKRNEFTPCTEV